MPSPSSSAVRAASTAANFGAMISRCRRMCGRTPSAEPKNSTCRRWLILSGPIEPMARWCRNHALLGVDAASTETPAPAKVILEVDANMIGRLG